MKCDYCKKDCATVNRHEITEPVCPQCAIEYAVDTHKPSSVTAPEYLNAIKQIVSDLEAHDLICYIDELRDIHNTLEDVMYDLDCDSVRQSPDRVTSNT